MAQHVSDPVRKYIEANISPAQKTFLDVALERRPSARFGAGPSTPQIGTNPSTSIDQAELIKAQPAPDWYVGERSPRGAAHIRHHIEAGPSTQATAGTPGLDNKVMPSRKIADDCPAKAAPR
jgi:hypothetical protein